MTLVKDLDPILKKFTNGIYLETGLASGESTERALNLNFNKVVTIEIDPDSVKLAKIKFKNYIKNEKLIIIEGDSIEKLEEVLRTYEDVSVIFLDAHDGDHKNNAPVENELEIIQKYYKNQLIIIDDFTKIKNNVSSSDPKRWAKKNNYKNIKKKLKEISNIANEYVYGNFGLYSSILINHSIKKINKKYLEIFFLYFLIGYFKNFLKKFVSENFYKKIRGYIIKKTNKIN